MPEDQADELTPVEAAKLLDIDPETVRRMTKEDPPRMKARVERKPGLKRSRIWIPRSEVDRIKREAARDTVSTEEEQ